MRFSQLFKWSLFLLILFTIILSCSKSNNDLTPTPVDPIDQAVQTLIDDALIVDYLQTHFYNAEDFQNPASDFNFDIIFDTIAGENSTQTPLFNQVETKNFVIDDVTFKYYILKVNEGFGNRPHFIDSTLVNFKGSLLNNLVFDSSANPIWFDMATVVDGFRQALMEFKSAESSSLNPDGTSTFTNFGNGAVFFPSGMGFANIPQPDVPANSPLIFRIKLFAALEADHDLDGIPSFMEDLNNNQNPSDDDTDGDRFPNYLDTNDDGDLILTIDEIIINPDGTITFPDCDGDGVPDYLDKDVCPK